MYRKRGVPLSDEGGVPSVGDFCWGGLLQQRGGRCYARSARGSPPGRVLPAIALDLHGPPGRQLPRVLGHAQHRQCVQSSNHITYFGHDLYIFVRIRALSLDTLTALLASLSETENARNACCECARSHVFGKIYLRISDIILKVFCQWT